MKYVYGPVPSRRLGFSLGIDVVPYKTCTLDCIYCQLGRTTQKRIKRKSFVPKDAIIEEIKRTIYATHNINFITFSGSGEPTLNSDIGSFINETKKITSIPVAVLTNGTLLLMEDVQKNLLEADVVLPSLDAASQEIFKRINRPHYSLKVKNIIDGLKKFRKIYRGQIWLEVMLLKGMNDNTGELSRIKEAIAKIKPDKVHLNTVVRPPSETYAVPLSRDELITIRNFLDKDCEVIAEFHRRRSEKMQNREDIIVQMTKRRPITIIDIANVVGISAANAEVLVERLKASGKIKERQYKEKKYYLIMAGKS